MDTKAKLGGILGIVFASIALLASLFYFFMLLIARLSPEIWNEMMFELEAAGVGFIKTFITIIIVVLAIYIILQIFVIVTTSIFMKTGNLKMTSGALNIATMSPFGITAGILILISE